MRKLLIFLTSCLLTFLVHFSVNAQNEKDSRNVLDYYKLTEFNLITEEDSDAEFLVKDLKNGFLKIKSKLNSVVVQVSLFRKNDGAAILVVFQESICSSIQGCGTDLDAYELEKNKDSVTMVSVKGEVFPKLSIREEREIFARNRKSRGKKSNHVGIKYELPRRGKVIKVMGTNFGEEDLEKNVLLYKLRLKDDKFVIIRK